MKSSEQKPFSRTVHPDGWICKSDVKPDKPRKLLVFIHGLRSNATACWDKKKLGSAWEKLADDWDFFGFQYGSQLWHSGDYKLATRDLSRALIDNFSGYQEYGFVVHSTGGLIVKKLLLENLEERDSPIDLFKKTKSIMNISVPHLGSSLWLFVAAIVVASSLAISIICCCYFLWYRQIPWFDYSSWKFLLNIPLWLGIAMLVFWSGCWVTGRFREKNNHYLGFHVLAWQLSLGRFFLEELHKRYTRELQELRKQILPVPKSYEFVGTKDNIIHPWFERHATSFFVNEELDFVAGRFDHSSFKITEELVNRMVKIFDPSEQCLDEYANKHGLEILPSWIRSQLRINCNKMNQLLFVDTLVGDSGDVRQVLKLLDMKEAGEQSQSLVARLVRLRLTKFTKDFGVMYIGGASGCGKSTALRAAAAQIGDHPFVTYPPIFLPLYRLEDPLEELSWETKLAERWADWCKELDEERNKQDKLAGIAHIHLEEFFRETLRKGTIVFVDGFDDYCSRHLGQAKNLDSIKSFVNEFREKFPNSHLVMTLRNGFVPRDRITMPGSKTISIDVAPLTLDDAADLARPDDRNIWKQKISELLENLNTDEERSVILLPVIVKYLKGIGDHGSMGMAIRYAVQCALDDHQTQTEEPTISMQLLATVAHYFYMNRLGTKPVDSNQVYEGIKAFEEAWDSQSWEKEEIANLESFTTRLLDCPLLLGRQLKDGKSEIKVFHNIWEEFLESIMMAWAVENGETEPLKHRPSLTRMYLWAGEILEGQNRTLDKKEQIRFTEKFVSEIFEIADELGYPENPFSQFPIGNLLGTVGHCGVKFESNASQILLNRTITGNGVCEPTPLTKMVAMQTLGFRCLAINGDGEFKDAFVASISQLAQENTETPLLSMSAKCYLEFLTNKEIEPISYGLSDLKDDSRNYVIPAGITTVPGQIFNERMQYIYSSIVHNQNKAKLVAVVSYLCAMVVGASQNLIEEEYSLQTLHRLSQPESDLRDSLQNRVNAQGKQTLSSIWDLICEGLELVQPLTAAGSESD